METGMINHLQLCVEDILRRRVPGDFLEAGVWRGGLALWMRGVISAHEMLRQASLGLSDDQGSEKGHDRTVWAADSFAGVPPTRNSAVGADEYWDSLPAHLYRASLDDVRTSASRFGLLHDARTGKPPGHLSHLGGGYCFLRPPVPPISLF